VIASLACAEAIMLTSAPIVVAPDHTRRREAADPAKQTPDAVAAQRRAGRRNRLADGIFKALCLLVASFLISVFGVVGGFYFYIVR